jgi:hypothetical protein
LEGFWLKSSKLENRFVKAKYWIFVSGPDLMWDCVTSLDTKISCHIESSKKKTNLTQEEKQNLGHLSWRSCYNHDLSIQMQLNAFSPFYSGLFDMTWCRHHLSSIFTKKSGKRVCERWDDKNKVWGKLTCCSSRSSSLAHPSVIALVLPLIIMVWLAWKERLAWKEMFQKNYWNQ